MKGSRILTRILLATSIIVTFLFVTVRAAEDKPAALPEKPDPAAQIVQPEKLKPARSAPQTPGPYTGKVVIISVGEEDLMSPARFEFMSRTLKRATSEGAEAVVFDLDTPGGLAWDTTTFIMQDLQKLAPRSVSFVNPRALSAGAMIAIGTDAIYMSKASTIGAATPVSGGGAKMDAAERAKMNSAMMAMARTAAKSKGHNPSVVEAMIDKDMGVKVGGVEVSPKGRIVTLDQEQATKLYDGKPLLAKGIVMDLAELKLREGFKGESITAKAHGFEYFALLITEWASILILIGIAGVYIEMQKPGFGVGGIIAALAFGLFFFGHYVAGSLVGYETVFIFVIGIAFLVVELFVFPGHVIFGLIGLACILGALIYTMAGWDVTVPDGKTFPVHVADYTAPLRQLAFGFVGGLVAIALLMRYFPGVGPFQRLMLQTVVAGEQASIEGNARSQTEVVKAGALGVTRSSMRPYGSVEFDGATFEAVVEGDYIAPDTPVRVRSVNGGRVVVERA
jgi:membrane-bound serine protease (ClpP class)